MPLCAVLDIKEQSRTHSLSLALSQQHLLKTGRKQPLKECCRRHTLLRKEAAALVLSTRFCWAFPLYVSTILGEKQRAAGRKAIFLFLPLRCERKIAQRELCVCIYCIRSQHVKRLMKSTRETDLSWLPLSKLLPSATRLVGFAGWSGWRRRRLKGPD